MNYAELREECELDGIGPLFWELLLAVCGRVARRYPPAVYNHGEPWNDESLSDLAQDVALQRLLDEKENQLGYVLRLATDEDSLARLLAFQIRRVLSHRRALTVVDRLSNRIVKLAAAAPFAIQEVGSDRWISDGSADPRVRQLTDSEVTEAVQLVASIPRIPTSPSAERESKIYGIEALGELVGRLVARFGGIALSDIRKILEKLLTAWLPTILREGEEDQATDSTPELELQRNQMRGLVLELTEVIDATQRTVLIGKSRGVSDGDLAAQLKKSRPWVADRKTEVLALVETSLISQLPPELHNEAIELLLDEIGRLDTEP